MVRQFYRGERNRGKKKGKKGPHHLACAKNPGGEFKGRKRRGTFGGERFSSGRKGEVKGKESKKVEGVWKKETQQTRTRSHCKEKYSEGEKPLGDLKTWGLSRRSEKGKAQRNREDTAFALPNPTRSRRKISRKGYGGNGDPLVRVAYRKGGVRQREKTQKSHTRGVGISLPTTGSLGGGTVTTTNKGYYGCSIPLGGRKSSLGLKNY